MPSLSDLLFLGRIIAMVANPRNGKTRTMVDIAKDGFDLGIPIYADFHIKGINCDEIKQGQSPLDYSPYPSEKDNHFLFDWDDIKNREFPKGSVLLLDELIKKFDNRLTMGKAEETKARAKLTQSFMQIGKKHLRVVSAQQIARTIDWRIAYLSEVFVVPRPVSYKIIDNEIVNVEFQISPIINEGIFGFKERPSYFMNEERFWYYAFDYDTDEPVLDDEEIAALKKTKDDKEKAKEKEKKKSENIAKSKEDLSALHLRQRQKIHNDLLESISPEMKSRLGLSPFPNDNNSAENNQTTPENSSVDERLIETSRLNDVHFVTGQSHYDYPYDNQTIKLSNWQFPDARPLFPYYAEEIFNRPRYQDMLFANRGLIYN